MAERVYMIALSPTMERGTLGRWLKQEGDTVKSGDLLCEVETDKATMEYESSQEGTLLKVLLAPGASAAVGDTIAVIGNPGDDWQALVPAAHSPAPVPVAAQAPATTATAPIPPYPAPATAAHSDSGRIKASPLARRLAKERGIDLGQISGSGPGGRIVRADLERAASTASTQTNRPTGPISADWFEPVSPRRAVIARRLSESLYTAPHFQLGKRIDASALQAARTAINAKRTGPGKISFNAFIIKLVAQALRQHPAILSSWEGERIRHFANVDIALAVDAGNGLITPVVRSADQKGIVEIDTILKDLIQRAGENRLQPEEYSNAGFTISNLGSYGIEEFSAIINPPASAILALGEILRQPVVRDDDTIAVAPLMKLTLSCDHRTIDGAAGAAFLTDLAAMLADPVRALW